MIESIMLSHKCEKAKTKQLKAASKTYKYPEFFKHIRDDCHAFGKVHQCPHHCDRKSSVFTKKQLKAHL
jgi:hypothetical protein